MTKGKHDRSKKQLIAQYYRNMYDTWACLGRDSKTFVGWVYGSDLRKVKSNLLNMRVGQSDDGRAYFVVREDSMEIIRVLPDDYRKATIFLGPDSKSR